MQQKWPDWRPCNFAIMVDGSEVQVVRYRRVRTSGPNQAVFDLVIVDPDTESSRKITVEMRRILPDSAEYPKAIDSEE
jgi:hypothetical protein